jgi:microsomal dipeptidase-like Zn-dependent dipeptidase
MHLLADDSPPTETYDRIRKIGGRPRWLDNLRAIVFRVFARRLNYRDEASSWRVDFDGLAQANAGLVMSVLFEPFAEFDLDEPPLSDPEDGYFRDLIEHLKRTDSELALRDPGNARHVRVKTVDDLDEAIASQRMAFVHCVEGGFHLGRTEEAIQANVAELATRGVGYVTLAHLVYRKIATNANAFPKLPDWVFERVFCQPVGRWGGLSKLGRAAVEAMYDSRVLIDVSHMNSQSLDETFALLDELDHRSGRKPEETPVISSHAGFRFGKQKYMHGPEDVERIVRRDGVIGLILARWQLEDGLSKGEGIDHTVAILREHIDRIRSMAGSNRHVGIGSDLDGFIKPTMSKIEDAKDLGELDVRLREAYPADADAILHDNALRVVRRMLAQRRRPNG